MIGLCAFCGEPAAHTCRLCGRLVCAVHLDASAGVCAECLRGTRAAR